MLEANKKSKGEAFVDYVIKISQTDTGYAAKMRRADNPITEDYAWEILAPWVDLENDYEKLPYALIGAAICREKIDKDGTLSLGTALAKSCEEQNEKDKKNNNQDKMYKNRHRIRLRRLLACDNIPEVCLILRQILRYLQSRLPGELSYSRLLNELCRFTGGGKDTVKQRWAKDYYKIVSPSIS